LKQTEVRSVCHWLMGFRSVNAAAPLKQLDRRLYIRIEREFPQR